MKYIYQEVYKYGTTEIDATQIKRLPDNAYIPNDLENTDWQAYQAWLAEGGVPLQPN